MRNVLFIAMIVTLLASCTEGNKFKNQTGLDSMSQTEQKKGLPLYLYKVLSIEDWEKSCKTVSLSSMDAAFIHFSTEDQLSKIIEKYWKEASTYLVLKVETSQLPGRLVLETNPGGVMQYYHLYEGSIPLKAIVELKTYEKKV